VCVAAKDGDFGKIFLRHIYFSDASFYIDIDRSYLFQNV
jgi:hypothetical protein